MVSSNVGSGLGPGITWATQSILRALRGEVAQFTGVSDPYEPPLNPDVVVDTDQESIEESVGKIVAVLDEDDAGMCDVARRYAS